MCENVSEVGFHGYDGALAELIAVERRPFREPAPGSDGVNTPQEPAEPLAVPRPYLLERVGSAAVVSMSAVLSDPSRAAQ